MTETFFDRPIARRRVQPRSVMNATTSKRLIAHATATLVLAAVTLAAAWAIFFTGAPADHKSGAPHSATVSRH
jgi:hypothetical protein